MRFRGTLGGHEWMTANERLSWVARDETFQLASGMELGGPRSGLAGWARHELARMGLEEGLGQAMLETARGGRLRLSDGTDVVMTGGLRQAVAEQALGSGL